MWRRVCVDLDDEHRPVGWSVEWRDSDGRLVELATGRPGPFDEIPDAFETARAQTPAQATLW